MSDDNLWLSILTEARQQATSKLPPNKSLLVLGENGSGKTTVIAKLRGIETPKKGLGFECAFIDVKDEYRDDHARLGVWIQDGDKALSYSLKFALNRETFPDTTIMFVVSMTTPWYILDQLQSWATILQDHIHKLEIPENDLKTYKSKCIEKWNEYVEHGDDTGLESNFKRTASNVNDKVVFENKPKTLTHNLGLDVIVVVTKTDYMATLEKDREYSNEHFDFIQQSIRRFCLQYGATLFYTSAKEDKNCNLLYRYLIHRIYNLPFHTPALTIEKDAVFIPSGWDNMRKISIICENFISMKPSDPFKDVIVVPPAPSVHQSFISDVEVHSEDEQIFLQKLFELQKISPKFENVQSVPNTPSIHRISDKQTSLSPLIQASLNASTSSPCEGALASFSNFVLHKKAIAQGKTGDTSSSSKSSRSSVSPPSKADGAVAETGSILNTSTLTKSSSSTPTKNTACNRDLQKSQYNEDKEISNILSNIMQNKKAEDIFQGSTKKIEDIMNVRLHNGMGFLHYAVLVNNKSVVEALIEKGADTDSQDDTGSTPLLYATSVDVAKLLINAGANINAKDDKKYDILTLAYILDEVDLLEYLITDTHIDVSSAKKFCGIPESTTNENMLARMVHFILYPDEEW